DYNFTYTEEHEREILQRVNSQEKSSIAGELRDVRAMLKGLSEDEYNKLVRYLSYPRGTTINSQETYNRMLRARKINDLLRHIGKNNLTLIGLDLAKVRDYYVGSLSKSGGRYLKTPSVIITYNDLVTTGGHNISSKISRVGSTSNYKSYSGGSAPVAQTSTPPASRPSSAPSAPPAAKPSPSSSPSSSAPRSSSPSSTGAKPVTSGSHPSGGSSPRPSTSSSSSASHSSTSASRPSAGSSGRPRASVISTGARSTRGF
ncbi:MAG: hypothetical protein J5799_03620, partial [Bacteroidales bacterium]|nr:hypothetical protein [Bacteroidales bacterium]